MFMSIKTKGYKYQQIFAKNKNKNKKMSRRTCAPPLDRIIYSPDNKPPE